MKILTATRLVMRRAPRIVLAVILALVFVFSLICYLVFTPGGASFIARRIIPHAIGAQKLGFKEMDGSLSKKITIQEFSAEGIKWLPQDSVLAAQSLKFRLTGVSIKGIQAEVSNGKISLPNSELILFYGKLRDGELDANVYSKNINVKNILHQFSKNSAINKISGEVREPDIYIKGNFLNPEFRGTFSIYMLNYGGFSAVNCLGSIALDLKRDIKGIRLNGEVFFKEGTVTGPNAITVRMQDSRILFSGDPSKPRFDLKGHSTVENVKINILLRGTADNPELKLSSTPSLPQEKLLIMLVTGKKWRGAETALSEGAVTPDLAVDFIDYFLLGGTGAKIAQKLGISDISLKLDKETKGIGLKKKVTDKAQISYGVEQGRAKEAPINQKVGGEYKVTESLSIGAEKELRQQGQTNQTQEEQKSNDTLTLKFKKEF